MDWKIEYVFEQYRIVKVLDQGRGYSRTSFCLGFNDKWVGDYETLKEAKEGANTHHANNN